MHVQADLSFTSSFPRDSKILCAWELALYSLNPSWHFPLAHCFLGVPEGHLVQTYMAECQG